MILLEEYDLNSNFSIKQIEDLLIKIMNICLINEEGFKDKMITQENKGNKRGLGSVMKTIMGDEEQLTGQQLRRKVQKVIQSMDWMVRDNLIYLLTQVNDYQRTMVPLSTPSSLLTLEEHLIIQL